LCQNRISIQDVLVDKIPLWQDTKHKEDKENLFSVMTQQINMFEIKNKKKCNISIF